MFPALPGFHLGRFLFARQFAEPMTVTPALLAWVFTGNHSICLFGVAAFWFSFVSSLIMLLLLPFFDWAVWYEVTSPGLWASLAGFTHPSVSDGFPVSFEGKPVWIWPCTSLVFVFSAFSPGSWLRSSPTAILTTLTKGSLCLDCSPDSWSALPVYQP